MYQPVLLHGYIAPSILLRIRLPPLSPTISDKLISVQKLYKKNPAEVEEDEDGAAVAGSGERCLDQAQVGLLVASVGRRYIDT